MSAQALSLTMGTTQSPLGSVFSARGQAFGVGLCCLPSPPLLLHGRFLVTSARAVSALTPLRAPLQGFDSHLSACRRLHFSLLRYNSHTITSTLYLTCALQWPSVDSQVWTVSPLSNPRAVVTPQRSHCSALQMFLHLQGSVPSGCPLLRLFLGPPCTCTCTLGSASCQLPPSISFLQLRHPLHLL